MACALIPLCTNSPKSPWSITESTKTLFHKSRSAGATIKRFNREEALTYASYRPSAPFYKANWVLPANAFAGIGRSTAA